MTEVTDASLASPVEVLTSEALSAKDLPGTPIDDNTAESTSSNNKALPAIAVQTSNLATEETEEVSLETPTTTATNGTSQRNGDIPAPKPRRLEGMMAAASGGAGESLESLQNIPLNSAKPTPNPPTPSKQISAEASSSSSSHPSPANPASPSPSASASNYRPSESTSSLQHFPNNGVQRGHSRQSSTTTTLSLSSHPSTTHGPQLSTALILPGLNLIVQSKEAKRSPPMLQAANRALELCQQNAAFAHPREIFEPLRLACETRVEKLVISSLDLLSKLISHSFFQEPNGPPAGQPPLSDLIAHTITISYVETSPPAVALQVVKALLSLVMSNTILVHQSSLLKAVRTVYNVFLLSPDTTNQMVAQGGLTQMVHHVFGRIVRGGSAGVGVGKQAQSPGSGGRNGSTSEGSARASPVNGRRASGPVSAGTRTPANGMTPASISGQAGEGSVVENDGVLEEEASGLPQEEPIVRSETPAEAAERAKMTLSTFDQPNPNDSIPAQHIQGEEQITVPSATISIAVPGAEALEGDGVEGGANGDLPSRPISTAELFVKDAFLVFRALCKLTMKPLLTESERDLRSHEMRSKLLSLHLVLTILQSHSDLFADQSITIPSASSYENTPFLQATKQYLCLSLSRNAVSPVIQVFELSVEIFWMVLKGLRAQMKKEIEVLFNEIFIPILEMKHATLRQKSLLLGVYLRLCQEPQALVEIYINYDCDRAAIENIYEKLVNIIARIGQTNFPPPAKGEDTIDTGKTKAGGPSVPQSLSGTLLTGEGPNAAKYAHLTPEQKLKRQSLECIVAVLKSLVAWATAASRASQDEAPPRESEDGDRPEPSNGYLGHGYRASISLSGSNTPDYAPEDDVEKFETAKQKKTSMLEGIKKFNFKPKRGVQFLVENGFIRSSKPEDVARFLLRTEGLSKAMIGEYLGEGDEVNVATMHAFVDLLDFSGMTFTQAVRLYLQSFRLPGEAQKIDRFMLKFAERYMNGNPNTEFANADTAYILAFSTIMLNTDAHNKNLKSKRMTKADFLKNNRGINDGKDLPEELLGGIYDEIQTNEIKMKDEVELPSATPGPGLAGTLANVGRDLQREAYVLQSEGMANKTEALFKTLVRQQRRGAKSSDHFYSASHLEHVRPMFEVAWMPFLAAISGPLQLTTDMDVVLLCLDGFKHTIKIVGLFDLELERNAFVSTLAKFTFLSNISEMKPKNVEAIKTMFDIAISDGNYLKSSWREVLTCVSQLERMQLISSGMDVPDLHRRNSKANGKVKLKGPADEVAEEGRSTQVTVAADMVFSLSKNLSGSAIVDFVRALSEVSWEEIQSSSSVSQPRLFSLQKLVEISYYNMGRIRIEWSNMWAILGEHFNQVCCHNNPGVSSFALDALRQLTMRFLEKEELSHFRFQKDFMRPFEYTMTHNTNSDARELVLQCMQQMLQARVQNLRSGWRTMFAVFSAASKVMTERIANYAFELVTMVYKDHFALVVRYDAFSDLTICITDFSKVTKFQKISLQAIDMLQGMVSKMLKSPECALPVNNTQEEGALLPDDPMAKYWFPVLFSFYDIIMTAEDLEVRRLALDSLFETLQTHGAGFTVSFWGSICSEVLFPIFAVLKSGEDITRFSTQEDMSVWLSTTMISALRNLIALYTYHFEILQNFLDGLLELLCACICQEHDTLARIGTACFQQLLENNVKKLSPEKWERVVSAFVQLFATTTAHQLFDESLRSEREAPPAEGVTPEESSSNLMAPAPLTPVDPNAQSARGTGPITAVERRRAFKQIIVKCVLQLLLIETTHELLQNDDVYNTIPAEHLLRFMTALDDSYQFARKFNADKDLRMALWKVGFMKQLPNLLKQESSSAATIVNVLLRMYDDPRPEHRASRGNVLKQFMPLGTDIMRDFNQIDADTQPRNIAAWTPVVTEVIAGCVAFEDESFSEHLPVLYPLITEMLAREMAVDLWQAVRHFYLKVGKVQGLIPAPADEK